MVDLVGGREGRKRLDKNRDPLSILTIGYSPFMRPLLLFSWTLVIYGQRYGDNDPIVIPTRGLESSFPNLVTSDNFPLFPFTDQFNTGMELNPANKISMAGDINVPVPGWGQFDVDGNLYFGHINFDSKIGWQIAPTNHLNIKPETLALIGQNSAFREARKKVQEVVVGRVPYGYEPIKCKPPFCNPFVHHTAVAVEVEEGDDTFFIGGIDFPFPLGPDGSGVRFPLSGAVEQGTSPVAYAHGHAFNPVSPFDMQSLRDDTLPPRKARRRTESGVEKEKRRRMWERMDKLHKRRQSSKEEKE